LKIWWGKGERNEVFIMNFKEIHSNTEFFSTYRRARRFPLQGKCHEVTKGFAESQICSCRNKIKNTFIKKWLEHSVQATFDTFRFLRVGVNCAKHKRHVAPNSRVNLGETVQCTVS